MSQAVEKEIRTLRAHFWSVRDPEGRAFAPLADAYRRKGELDEAVSLVRDGLARLPDFTPGHLVAARIHRARGDLESAEAALDMVLQLDAENILALLERAELARDTGDRDGAMSGLRRLLALDPRHLGARSTLDRLESAEPPVPPVGIEEEEEKDLQAAEPEGGSGTDPEATGHSRDGGEEIDSAGLLESADLSFDELETESLVLDELDEEAPAESTPSKFQREEMHDPDDLSAASDDPATFVDLEYGDLGDGDLEDGEIEDGEIEGRDLEDHDLDDDVPATFVDLEDDGSAPALEESPLRGGADTGDLDVFGFDPASEIGGEIAAEEEEDVAARFETDRDPDLRPELVTRTMAEIFVRQGLPARAIEIYERLLEREPENEEITLRLAELRAPDAGSASAESLDVLPTERVARREADHDTTPSETREEADLRPDDRAPQWTSEPEPADDGERLATPFAWDGAHDDDAAESVPGRSIRAHFDDLVAWVPGAVPVVDLAPGAPAETAPPGSRASARAAGAVLIEDLAPGAPAGTAPPGSPAALGAVGSAGPPAAASLAPEDGTSTEIPTTPAVETDVPDAGTPTEPPATDALETVASDGGTATEPAAAEDAAEDQEDAAEEDLDDFHAWLESLRP